MILAITIKSLMTNVGTPFRFEEVRHLLQFIFKFQLNHPQALSQAEKDKYGYEYELMILLSRLVEECDRRVKKHTERIRAEQLVSIILIKCNL